MKILIFGAIVLAAMAMVPILSYNVPAQGAPGFDRHSCLQNCAWLRPFGNNFGQYMNYHNCIARCESQFWQHFDRNTKDLEKDSTGDRRRKN